VPEYKVPLGVGPQEIQGGRFVGPGETVELTAKEVQDPLIAQKIEDGVLMETTSTAKKGGDKS
jgi:hypothetical protein